MAPSTVDQAIAEAKDLPTLVAGLSAVDPGLARQFQGKALLESRTPLGTLLVTGVTYLAAKYALGWDQATDELVAGLALLVVSYAIRLVTSAPIAGLFKKKVQ